MEFVWKRLKSFVSRRENSSEVRPGSSVESHRALIESSGLFDKNYYLQQLRTSPTEPSRANTSGSPFASAGRSGSDGSSDPIDPIGHYLEQGWRHDLDPHPLFDTKWYRATQIDSSSGCDEIPLVHFLKSDPLSAQSHRLVDPEFYFTKYPENRHQRITATQHYLRWGEDAAMDPHPLFSLPHFRQQCPQLNHGSKALIHFLASPSATGLSPHPLFNLEYYCRNTRCDYHSNPLLNYLLSPNTEVQFPHPLFDEAYYLLSLGAKNLGGRKPLEHFLMSPPLDAPSPHRLFDSQFYLRSYQDVSGHGVNPLLSFVTSGAVAGRFPHAIFDSEHYFEQCRGQSIHCDIPVLHYLDNWKGGRALKPNKLFDQDYYLRAQGLNLSELEISPLEHYLSHGVGNRAKPHPNYSYHYEELNQCQKDQTVFILGAGPQLNCLTSEHKSLLERSTTIGMNRTDYKVKVSHIVSPYFVTAALAKLRNPSVKTVLFRSGLEESADADYVVQQQLYNSDFKVTDRFEPPVPLLLTKRNSAFAATHLAHIMGASTIVYIGVEQNNSGYYYYWDDKAYEEILADIEKWEAMGIVDSISYTTGPKLRQLLIDGKASDEERPYYQERFDEDFCRIFSDLKARGVRVIATKKESVVCRAGGELMGLDEAIRLGGSPRTP